MMEALVSIAAIGLMAFGYWIGCMKRHDDAQNDTLDSCMSSLEEKVGALIAERDLLMEQNRRLRNELTAKNLAMGLAGKEFQLVPKKVSHVHFVVKDVKRG